MINTNHTIQYGIVFETMVIRLCSEAAKGGTLADCRGEGDTRKWLRGLLEFDLKRCRVTHYRFINGHGLNLYLGGLVFEWALGHLIAF